MGWFGTSKEEVWRELCQEIGADFVEGGFWKGKKVQIHKDFWTITLDTFTQSAGNSHVTYTRMRAPFVNPEGFTFTIYRRSVFSDLGKRFGMQDIEVGGFEFDEDFVIKSNDESRVRELFADSRIRDLTQAQPKIRLEVKGSEGWFGPRFPADVDELHFQAIGVIKDVDRLKSLFDLFALMLERLYEVGIALKQDPEVKL